MDLLLQLPSELLGLSQAWFGPLWGGHLYTLVKTLVLIACIVVPV